MAKVHKIWRGLAPSYGNGKGPWKARCGKNNKSKPLQGTLNEKQVTCKTCKKYQKEDSRFMNGRVR